MSQPSVTETPAVEPEREEKAVAELEPGTWVEVIDDDGDWIGEARVLHVETYDDEGRRRSLLLYAMPGYVPDSLRCDADMTMPLLTDEQIGKQLEGERREEIASRFDKLAEMFREAETPLPETWRGITVDVDFGVDVSKLDVIAEALALKVSNPASGSMFSVLWEDDRGHSAGVNVQFHGYRAKGTPLAQHEADPTGLAYTRADDEHDDPTPVSPARVPLHTGAMTDGGLVDETERRYVPAEDATLTPLPPGLAGESESETVHMAYVAGGTVCGLPAKGSAKRRQALVWREVTCDLCAAKAAS